MGSNIIFDFKEKLKSCRTGNVSNDYKKWKTITFE